MSDSTPFENYLSSKGLFIDTLTPQQLSEARAYETCYNWYIENQKVSADTADIASTVFIQKYALHNNEGICLENTPEDMWDRVANVLADEEIKTNTTSSVSRDNWYKLFRNILTDFKYTPQGSGLYSLGNPYVKSSASNCFVVPSPDDSLESIFDTAKSMARIYAARGGVGVDLSNLRPYGAVTNNAAKSSTGAASFMDFYSHVTATIGQCIEENQKVLTLRGNLSIKDVIPGDSVWTRKGWIKNLNTLNNGVKPVFKLTTKRGFEITATANHIFLSGDNSEKQLGDFVVGDSIITMPGTPVDNLPYVKLNTVVDYDQGHGALNGGNRLNEVSLPEELTEELAYLIGYSFGDGYVERDAFMEVKEISLASSHDHPEVEAKLVNISKSKFAYSPSIKQKAKERVNSVRIFSKKLGFYLEQNGLLKQKHNALIMPDVIWQSRTSVQMAFISGYFDADGYASGNKKGYVIASVHMPILKDMQQMLMSAGIVSHISTELRNGKEKTENWKNLHSLSITGAYSQAIAIKMLSESVKIANKAFIAKRDNVLTPFTAKDCGIKYNKYSFVPDNTQKMSAKCYSKLQEEKLITDNITILDTVAAIEYIGEKPVFDLQLESEHLYVSAGMIVHNSGRRGALMLSLRVDHPDIFRFIEMKRDLDKQWFFDELASYGININDWKYSALADRLKSTSHANVSVKLTDKFIKAVEEDADFELYFDFKENKYSRISNIVKARSIWDKLVEGATQSAEPGMFNWDKIISESPADCYSDMTEYIMPDGNKVSYSFRTLSTNPCISGDSYVLTSDGYKQVNSLLETPWKALVNGISYDATPFWKTGDKETYSITLANGTVINATSDHKLQLSDDSWVSVSDSLNKVLKGNVIEQYKDPDITSKEFKTGWLAGSVVGDGYYTSSSGSAVMYWGCEANEVAAYANQCLNRASTLTQVEEKIKIRTNAANTLLSSIINIDTKELKPEIYQKSKEFISGFLSGLVDADGSVQGTALKGYSIRLSQSNSSLLYHCQRLFNMLGVKSRVYTNRRLEETKYWKQGNKEYVSKPQHELVISSSQIVACFNATRLITPYKYKKIQDIISTTSFYSTLPSTKVIKVETNKLEPVYDCTVDRVHCFDLNGIIAHNCGELPLSAGDSCCLGTHRLTAFVINPFKDNAKFDWANFEETVRLSTRAQDNIKNIDIDLVPLQVNKDSAILGRRIGLGCTGLSDALAMLGLRYDSKEAVETAKKIYKLLRDTVYATSIQLAEEKGAFLAYDKAKEVNNPFLQRLPKELQGKPRRNIACLTNAPNGSMAILMSNEASGIEPCFKKTYERSMKIPGTNDFRRFTVYHQAIQKCIDAGGNPDVFVEANDVNGEMRIALQAGIQEFIDHSISVTTNLPVGTTKERVADLYLKAFKAGCKGFTIYIDECRTGVLNSIKEPVKIHKTIERPKTTNIDIHKVKYKEKNWAVLVGRVDNGPCEVFAGIEEDTPLPNKYHRAELTKKSRGHYSLTVFLSEDEDDLIKISNIGARFPSPEGMTLTRFISLSLKNGVSVADICEQLTKSSNSMFDYPAVLNRVLKNYVTEEEYLKKNGDKQCPECNGTLVFRKVDGCMIETCETCSYTNSKCG